MIYILNKGKMLSYVIASTIVVGIFVFSSSIIQKKDIEVLKISSNVIDNNILNSISNIKNNY